MFARLLFSAAAVLLPVRLIPSHAPQPMKLLKQVTVSELEGPIPHLAVDVKGQRIFLAASNKNAIEIFDAQTLRHTGTISGLAAPQDVVFVPETGSLLISNGADGSFRVYDGATLKLTSSKLMGGDADRIQVGAGGKTAFVGWGVGSIAMLDLHSGKRVDIQLKSHPDAIQLDSAGNRIFVNMPGVKQLAVIERKSQFLAESWPVHPCRDNGPMALDEANRRIFVVCRKPAKLLVLNMDDGAIVATMSTVEDADDVFYDRERKRVYVVGGEGYIAAHRQKGPDEYGPVSYVETSPGGRSGLFVPEWNRIYVAARNRPPVDQAEILSFAILDDPK
jgi:DNA-binding beta-propeller fold protein YncE